ncbi:MAG TPA: FHA domain-containing protein, partial [Blastocatellia bacterium]|nr:FHA domain-containing protein [Blastocatellia bacterium]
MPNKSRFIIKRTDRVRGIDDVVLDSEGLTIGRLTGNDLVLNHRAVSRTHAGIKEIEGEYRIFNLSQANGTLVNGQLVDRQATLSDGDIIQIGPFVLTVNYIQRALQITVEMDLEVVPLEAQADLTALDQSDSSVATMLIKIPAVSTAGAGPARGTRQLSGTGLLSKVMPEEEEAALDIFWEKRKREAGKIAGQTPLHPKGGQKFGRAQNNWRPTFDLRKPWRKSYFSWGAVIITIISAAAFLVYESYYSPGDVSDPHFKVFSKDFLLKRNIANDSNASCSTCHGIQSMQQKCEGCHTTQPAEVAGQMVAGFSSEVYVAHEREGVTCSECHTEHQGYEKEAGLLNYGLCYNCHNGEYRIRVDGEIGPAGTVLPIPHGGTVGYPVENGKWTWPALTAEQLRKKRLPETWESLVPYTPNNQYGASTQAELDSANQFHAIHSLGKMSKMIGAGRGIQCFDCHSGEIPTAGARGSQLFRESPRNECAKCHGVSFADQAIQTVQANCSTCHLQH